MIDNEANVRLTIVHERFTEFAGSEQVVARLAAEWPQARVVAPLVRPTEPLPPALAARVRGTRLSRLVSPSGGYAHLLPVLPVAMRHLDLGSPDAVLISHHAFANQVALAPAVRDLPIVSYVHSPARWVWDPHLRSGEFGGRLGGALLAGFARAYRRPDRRAAEQVTSLIANSTAVAERIARWWQLPARVVAPPVDIEFFMNSADTPREDFFLLAGRLVPYKRPDLAVRAARDAGVRLVVAGDGRMRAECEAVAGPHTTFLGRVSDEQLRDLYSRCAALLMPGVEDFGIVPVEAQATGAPVIATGRGGALDTVVPGRTGILVETAGYDDREWAERWTEALRSTDPTAFDHAQIRRHAQQFSVGAFVTRMRQAVTDVAGLIPDASAAPRP